MCDPHCPGEDHSTAICQSGSGVLQLFVAEATALGDRLPARRHQLFTQVLPTVAVRLHKLPCDRATLQPGLLESKEDGRIGSGIGCK